MTNAEAISLLKQALAEIEWTQPMQYAAAIDKAIEALEGKDKDVPTKWISVKDRLPENQNPVVVFVPPHVDNDKGTFLGYVGMAYFTRLGEEFWCGTDGNLYGAIGMIYPPTHWMPLPEPPKEGGNDENA